MRVRSQSSVSKLLAVIREEVAPSHVRYRAILATRVARLFPTGTFMRARTAVLRAGGCEIGPGSVITGPLRLWGAGRLVMGANSTISGPCAICLDADVVIGDGVLVGHDTVFATGHHEIGGPQARGGRLAARPITIDDGAWIGAGALVLPGVSIGAGAVVAAGSVVHRDVPANTLVGGVPAAAIRELSASPAT